MDLDLLIRENLKRFASYTPGEQPVGDGWLKLNTNENPYPPIPEVIEEIKAAVNDKIRLYPDPLALEVRKAVLNQLLRDENTLTNRNTVFVGNGSDEVLDVLFKVFIGPRDDVVFFHPSYGMYKVLASLYDARITEINLNANDFSIPESAFSARGKLFFISSPNNPNGKSFGNATILKICNNFPGIVVVDEAYADFSEITSLSLLKKVKNLVVLRTLSKSFSFAAQRLGYAIADASIIKEMNKVKLPFNVSYLTQIAAVASIKHRRKILERNKKIIEERGRLAQEINGYNGVNVLPSDANFIFIRFAEQSKAFKFVWDLKDKHKILVRHFSKTGLYQYMRVTIGTEEQNNKFLNAFRVLASDYL